MLKITQKCYTKTVVTKKTKNLVAMEKQLYQYENTVLNEGKNLLTNIIKLRNVEVIFFNFLFLFHVQRRHATTLKAEAKLK